MSWRFCGLILAFAFGLIRPITLFAKPDWRIVENSAVRVISDASEKDLQTFALNFSAYRRTFADMLMPPDVAPPPVTVVLFRNFGQMHDYLPKGSMLVFKADVDDSLLMAISLKDGVDTANSLAAEFDAVWSLGRAYPGLPLWATQGTGEALCSVRVKDGQRLVGAVDRSFDSEYRRHTNVPWERFFYVNTGSYEYQGSYSEIFHAQAWALMHYLLFRDAGGANRFAALTGNLRRTTPSQAVAEVLGFPLANLDRKLDQYVPNAYKSARAMPLPQASSPHEFAVNTAIPAIVGVSLSELLSAAQRFPEADEELDRAVASAPASVAVLEAQARREIRRRKPEQALHFYRAAIEAGTSDSSAYLWSADAYLAKSRDSNGPEEPGGGGAEADLAARELRKALEFRPGNQAVIRQLAHALYLAPKATASDVSLLSAGVRENDDGLIIRYYRALLYVRFGLHEKAAADLATIADASAGTDVLRRSARDMLDSVRVHALQDDVRTLLQGAHYAEARIRIKAAAENKLGQAQPSFFAALTAFVDDTEAWAKMLQLKEEGHQSELRVMAEQFLRSRPGSVYESKVRELLQAGETK